MTKKHFLVLIVLGVVAVALLGLTSKVLAASVEPRIIFFNASALIINSGESITLTWETAGLTDCRITRAEEEVIISGGGCGNVNPDGTCQHNPPATSTYALNCGQEGRLTERHSKQISVQVWNLFSSPPARFIKFSGCAVAPRSITANITATRTSLPSGMITTNINWRGTTDNICPRLIGSGVPETNNIWCGRATDNWLINEFETRTNFNQIEGVGTISGTGRSLFPSETQGYGINCIRGSFGCFSRSIKWHSIEECERECHFLETDEVFRNFIDTCYCYSLGPIIDFGPAYAIKEVRSGPICSSLHSDSQQVRVVQEPRIDNSILRTDPARSQILLNQFINLVWSVNAPDSSVPTTIRCTPSIAQGGDGEGWTTGAGIPSRLLDSLPPSGRRNNLSPSVTTTYKLLCRNIATDDPSYFPFMASSEVRVFTPDVKEIPSFYDGFMRVVGIITNNLR